MALEMDSLNVATAGAIALHWLSATGSDPWPRETG
jgi:tRNA G18 (ribose-2'-O)-methylase SpoU